MGRLRGGARADEVFEHPFSAARDDDDGAGGPVDEPARDAAEQHAAERAVAARAADEQVDVVAELLKRGHRAVHEHFDVRSHRRLHAVDGASQSGLRPLTHVRQVRLDVVGLHEAGRAPGDGVHRGGGVQVRVARGGKRGGGSQGLVALLAVVEGDADAIDAAHPLREPGGRDGDRAARAVQKPVRGGADCDLPGDAAMG